MKLTNVFLWMFALAMIGAGVGSMWDASLWGLLAGALLGWPIGLAIETHKRRWWAIALLVVFYVAAWEMAGLEGLILCLGCTGLTLFISSAVLRDLYDGSEVRAFVHHIKILTGVLKGFHIVSEGKNVVPSEAGMVFGPCLVIVKPDTAVILERGSRHTQVRGPGTFESGAFEYVKSIFDLKPQTKTLRVPDVRTKDHLQVTVQVSLLLGIQVRSAVRQGGEPISDNEKRRLHRIHSYHQDWLEATSQEIISNVRRHVAEHTLEQILEANQYDVLAREVVRNANKRVNTWGIRIDRAIIEMIQPRPEVAAKMEERWVDGLKRQSFAAEERSRAFAWADAVQIMADGYRVAKERNMPPEAVYSEVVRRTLEKIASEPGLHSMVGMHMAAEIEYLRRSAGIHRDAST